MSISNKALLVNLSISCWLGKRIDHQATGTVETSHKTDKRVGSYTKKLLPGAKELDNIQTLAGALRVFFYRNTLPWATDGSRIISSKNYMEFTEQFRAKKAEFDNAVLEFLTAYPILREQAKVKLGELYQEFEYPNNLQHYFGCKISFMPVPDISDFRVELTEEEKQTFLDSMDKVEKDALKECWERLSEVVSKARDRLLDPSAVFRNSLIYNVHETCDLISRLNVTENKNLETVCREAETLALNISPDKCRENNAAREEAAAALAAISDRMSGFMG